MLHLMMTMMLRVLRFFFCWWSCGGGYEMRFLWMSLESFRVFFASILFCSMIESVANEICCYVMWCDVTWITVLTFLLFWFWHLLSQRLGAMLFVKYVLCFQLRCYTSLDVLCMMIVDENDSRLFMKLRCSHEVVFHHSALSLIWFCAYYFVICLEIAVAAFAMSLTVVSAPEMICFRNFRNHGCYSFVSMLLVNFSFFVLLLDENIVVQKTFFINFFLFSFFLSYYYFHYHSHIPFWTYIDPSES
jgi:hypothetical protein